MTLTVRPAPGLEIGTSKSENGRSLTPDARVSPIRILHIINDLSIGGAEMMLVKLLSATDRQRFDPVVISLIDRGSLRKRVEAMGIPVYTPGMKPALPSLRSLLRFIRLVRLIKPQLVQGWLYHGSLAAQFARAVSSEKVPALWNVRTSIETLATEKRLTAAIIKLGAIFSGLADRIVFASRVSHSQHLALGYKSEKSCVIVNGFDVKQFVPSAQARIEIRAELNIPAGTFLIGLMGRYHAMKDHASFLRAAALLLKERPDVHFLLAGRGVDKANRTLNRMIQELGLGGHTHLLGERCDMPRLVGAPDILSLVSFYGESFPNIVGEAMACGVPCAVTAVGDAGWIVGKTGRVVPSKNPAAMASAWKDLVDLGPEGLALLGKAARCRVKEFFTIESVVAEYESLYESVISEKLVLEQSFAGRTEPLLGKKSIQDRCHRGLVNELSQRLKALMNG